MRAYVIKALGFWFLGAVMVLPYTALECLQWLGRTEWLAEGPDDYVRIASGLAADAHALNALRLSLRSEVENSALMREDLYCRHFGEGLRVMWLKWLAQAEHPLIRKRRSRPSRNGYPSSQQSGSTPRSRASD